MNLNQSMINTARSLQVSLGNHTPSIAHLLTPTAISSYKNLDDTIDTLIASNADALIYTIRLYKILKYEYDAELKVSLDTDINFKALVNDDVISYGKLRETDKLVFEIIVHLSLLKMKE